jgi:hypothetical protein
MTIFIFSDNARSTLAAPITLSSGTLSLSPGGGARFPNPGPGQQFAVTLNDLATQSVYEVCWCTARNGDQLTVLRGQEGSSTHAWGVGDYVWNGPTAGQMNNLVQTPSMFDASIAPTFATTVIQGEFFTTGPAHFSSTGDFFGSVTAVDPNQATAGGLNINALPGSITGAGIALNGTGDTPRKFIRAVNGNLDIVNSAYNQAIFGLSDLGDIFAIRNLTANGGMTADGPVISNSYGQFTDTSPNAGSGGVIVDGGPNGANIALREINNAGSKFLRCQTNTFGIVNSAYTQVLLSLDDLGNLAITGSQGITGSLNVGSSIASGAVVSGTSVQSNAGNVTANNGRLRATFGARGSQDPSAATILADFTAQFTPNGYQIFPNGLILQWGTGTATDTGTNIFYPIAFPNACVGGATVVAFNQGFNGNTMQIFRFDPTGFACWGNNLVTPLAPATIGFYYIVIGF